MVLLALVCSAGARGRKAASRTLIWESEFHSVTPLGSELFVVEGHKGSVLLMATALTPEIEGWKRFNEGGSRFVCAEDGRRIYSYPRQVQFRVTASASERAPVSYDPLSVKSDIPVNEYLLGLRFRIKIFHALHVSVVEPTDVHMLGVPAAVSYNERIYRVSFQLPTVPVQDRMVLEVLSPEGTRLARFHFELM